MNILVTGATGFIGCHVVGRLLENGHNIIVVVRNREKAKSLSWFGEVNFIESDLHREHDFIFRLKPKPDAILHLAWSGLPNYKDFFHIDENLISNLSFLKTSILSGISQLVIAGTCLEYGMQYGPLDEEQVTLPITPYGFAKDTLRKALQIFQQNQSFTLQWARLFYMFGKGQNENSLLPQLDRAIESNQPIFNMSKGDQLRDYLSIEEVSNFFVLLIENKKYNGVINICSGHPISVRSLVEKYCQKRNSNIKINYGYYPYPDYEPLAFWGIQGKLKSLIERTSCKSHSDKTFLPDNDHELLK